MPDTLLKALQTFCEIAIAHTRPGFIARRLCPELVFVKPDFAKYSKASAEVRTIFRDYDPDLDAASLDEAYMDVTDYCKAHQKSGLPSQLQPSSHTLNAVCHPQLPDSGMFCLRQGPDAYQL